MPGNAEYQSNYAKRRYKQAIEQGRCVYCKIAPARMGKRGQQTRSCEECFQKYKRDTGRLSKTWRDSEGRIRNVYSLRQTTSRGESEVVSRMP